MEYIVRSIFSVIAELIGVAGAFMPSAVKEHFFSSGQRMLSFIFLVFIIKGAAKFILSALKSITGSVFGALSLSSVLDNLTNFLFSSFADSYWADILRVCVMEAVRMNRGLKL